MKISIKNGKIVWMCDKCGKQINQSGAPGIGIMVGKYCCCRKGFNTNKKVSIEKVRIKRKD